MKQLNLLIISLGILILGLITPLCGQQAIIRGNITDAETGLPIVGATVRAFQKNDVTAGAYSDVDGDYQMKLVPGTYILVTTYLSFRADTSAVTASADNVTFNQTLLIPDVTTLEGVDIVAQSNNQTVDNLIRQKQNSINTIDGIPFELMQRAGANTAADGLRRVTGVSITDGKYVSVRGLSDRYNRTLINMGEIPPLDPDKETVQMDRFPSNLIDNIVVYKNFTPDLPGSFTAGLIDVQTKSHPIDFELNVRASTSYNTVSSLRDDFLTHEGGNLAWLGIDGQERLPNDLRDELARTNSPLAVVGTDGERLPRNVYTNQRVNSGLNQNYSFTIGDQVELFGRPLGYVASFTYRNTYQVQDRYLVGRYSYQQVQDTVTRDAIFADGNGEATNQEVQLGGIVNLAYTATPNHKFRFMYMRSQGGSNTTSELAGLNETSTVRPVLINNTADYIQQQLNSFQLSGKHQFGKLAVDWVATQSYSDLEQPDFRVLSYNAEIDRTVEIINDTIGFDPIFQIYEIEQRRVETVDTTNRRSYLAGETDSWQRYFRFLSQTTTDIKLNLTLPLPIWDDGQRKFEIKAGGAVTQRARDFNSVEFGHGTGSSSWVDETGGFYGSSVNAYLRSISSEPNPVLPYFDLAPPGVPYRGTQDVYAGYAMAEIRPSKQWSVIAGARLEVTDMLVDGPGDGPANDNEFQTNDWLPALHMIYRPIKNINLRLGYSRTVARPSFREASLFFNRNFTGDYRVAGSPNTRRSLIDNMDLRLEWFPSRGELISISGYYKEILGPIELSIISANELNVLAEYTNLRTDSARNNAINPIIPKEVEDELAQQFDQVGDLAVALAYGIEVEVRKHFGFLGTGWEKLQFWGNYSLLKTEVPLDAGIVDGLEKSFGEILEEVPERRQLYGQPSYTLNMELAYVDREKLGLDISASYAVFGDRLVLVLGAGVNVVEKSRGLLNVSVRKQLGKHFSIRARANNLLNPAFRREFRILGFESPLDIYEDYFRGRSFSIGITYEL